MIKMHPSGNDRFYNYTRVLDSNIFMPPEETGALSAVEKISRSACAEIIAAHKSNDYWEDKYPEEYPDLVRRGKIKPVIEFVTSFQRTIASLARDTPFTINLSAGRMVGTYDSEAPWVRPSICILETSYRCDYGLSFDWMHVPIELSDRDYGYIFSTGDNRGTNGGIVFHIQESSGGLAGKWSSHS